MKRVPLIVTWMLGATLLASAQTSSFFYPHVVDGVLGATTWKTTIFLTNPSSATATGAITFTQDHNDPLAAGSAWQITLADETGFPTTSSVFTFSLPPGASHKYVSSATGGFVSGFANVTTNSGTVSGAAVFSEFDTAGNLMGEAGVPSASPVLRQTILVDTLGGYSVGVAYANPGTTSIANISLTLLDNSGNAVAAPVTQTLGPGNHVQGFTSQFFKSAARSVGTMQITSSTPMVAISLRFDPTLSKFTTLPPVTLASLISTGMEWLQDRRQRMLPASLATLLGAFHLFSGTRTSDCFGGPPRRQKTSGSMVST
jgi:hypothetical protein